MENHLKIKFLHESDEKERVTQTVQAIIGRFDSDALGFFTSSNDLFFNDRPIQRFEDLCIMYDLDELSELENVKLLGNFLSDYHGVDSYPNICCLLELIKQKSEFNK